MKNPTPQYAFNKTEIQLLREKKEGSSCGETLVISEIEANLNFKPCPWHQSTLVRILVAGFPKRL